MHGCYTPLPTAVRWSRDNRRIKTTFVGFLLGECQSFVLGCLSTTGQCHGDTVNITQCSFDKLYSEVDNKIGS